jgi:hypothetical protein
MKNLKTAALALLAATALAAPGVALAATDGTAGTTSSAQFTASLTVLPDSSNFVQILGLTDLNLGTLTVNSGGNTRSATNAVCLKRTSTGPVAITISGPARLSDGLGHSVEIGFAIGRYNDPGPGLPSSTTHPTPSDTFFTAEGLTASIDCTGIGTSVTHEIRGVINIPSNSGTSAVGILSGVYTMTLSPG